MKVIFLKNFGIHSVTPRKIYEANITTGTNPRIQYRDDDGDFRNPPIGGISFEEVKEQTMTKDDLKTGMVVETRGEGKYIVLGNMFVSVNEHMRKNQYMDNLISNGQFRELDIISVYEEPKSLERFNDLQMEKLELIWTREPSALTEAKEKLEEALKAVEEAKAVLEKVSR